MEMAQVINPKTNPVNSSISKMTYEEVQVLSNLQDTGNGTLINVDGKSSVVLYVTGSFVATIVAQGSTGTSFPPNTAEQAIKAYDVSDEKYVTKITKPGVYVLENIGYSKFRVRVDRYTSGSVSVLARAFVEPIELGQSKERKKPRLERVAEKTGYKVSANQEVMAIPIFDCSDYVYLFVVARSNTAHSRRIAFNFSFSNQTLGPTYGDVYAIDDSKDRSKSERIEPLSESVSLWVKNNDSAEHTYDIFVYGVR